MSLAARLQEAKKQAPTGFDLWVERLSKEDRDALMVAAADPDLKHRVFHEIVRGEGASVGRERLTDWRKAHGFPRR